MPKDFSSPSSSPDMPSSMATDIVVIDDDTIALELVQRFLKNTDYALECFDSPSKALRFLEFNRVRLLLVDSRMPELSGIEVLGSLTEDTRASIGALFLCSAEELPDSLKAAATTLGAASITKDHMNSKQEFLDFVSEQMGRSRIKIQ